ncbi:MULTISPECIES: Holliday junction resolvase RuvX [Pseudoalteromonas]|jgi:putative Holliday junction resolvase|uniref:Putative pre-16S rRNA nuclease n=1 Tax=Pseudoalteromonas sp. SD03 TaxID=3231719 RepID=A0AB39ANM3_9GAMM|nr:MULTISPECIES: Holliday junction resolvase RuvX [Pseudoalteromonas]MAY57720.1 Holliday junction resolvase RuvX [Pseudoalteromonas sp.]KGK02982.1 Holliday junction resolvase [Pseudoalteromonas sp. ND6B]MDN3401751.1 Holliday junction resolvase RuvX [Pseudoalteromonas sp. APC 3213]MDN3408816.1 Holliday junction resolvase RuvX [Pseudoalteromonas sp. APC 3894]MDN3413242.1 Holliday junction resolvase RuvX [Pseudoalteromonas sp. APC 3250]|tara:strand:+ start:40257 stop:40706 length:450 start_codon:yes stop_codon:yes gene_type:complete
MTKKIVKPQGERTVMGFDFGTKSIGIAIGQELTGSATSLKAVKAQDGIPNWDDIAVQVKEWQPDLMVVGLPLNMDGTSQEVTFKAKKFANRLHNHYGIAVHTQDERLTTADAKARLFERGGYKNLGKGNVDNMSAVIILESFFEASYGE